MKTRILMCVAMTALVGCANRSVNDVAIGDSGQAFKVKFGTVLQEHPVSIRSSAQAAGGGGAVLGGISGAGLGQSNGAVLGGALLGGLVGVIAHNIAEKNNGIEYTIAFTDGTTQVIDQIQASTDQVFQAGAPVMVQFGANTNRVLSAANLPDSITHPKEVHVEGAPPPPSNLGVQTCQAGFSWDTAKQSCTSQ